MRTGGDSLRFFFAIDMVQSVVFLILYTFFSFRFWSFEPDIIMCALLPALLRVCVRPLEVVCCSSAGGYPELGPHLHTHTLNISTFHSPASIKWLPKRVVMNGSRSVTQLHQKHIEHIGPRQGAAVCMGAAFDYSIRLRKTFDRYRSNRRRYGNH